MTILRQFSKRIGWSEGVLSPCWADTAVSTIALTSPAEVQEQCDRELIDEVLQGQVESFSVLVRRHEQRVFALIQRQVANADLAADLAQDVFVRAYRGLAKFKGRSAFSTWLTRIALNVTHSYFSSRRYRESLSQAPVECIADLPSVTETDPAFKEHLLQLMQRYLGELKPKFREVVVLCILERHTYREAAVIIGVPEGTVCSRMNSALEQLRQKMEKHRP